MFTLILIPLHAHHGPGSSAGGVSTDSGETLEEGKWALDFRTDYTYFEPLSRAEIQSKTLKIPDDHAHFDALKWSLLETVELDYGITDNFQLGFSTGWYRGENLREGHIHGDGSFGFHEFGDVSGMTDLWVNGKYRVMKGHYGNLAVLLGIKLPTGRDDVRGDGETEALEADLQPGSGAIDFNFGLAHTFPWTRHVTTDASFQYTLRTEANDFELGDRISVGLAVAYRFNDDPKEYPRYSVFLEGNVRHFFRNKEAGESEVNSGGTEFFISPGFRIGINRRLSFSVSPQFPLVQDLNSEQQETEFKLSVSLELSF